jgi:hypothetical protein
MKIGQRVKVSRNNDNESYDSFRDKVLIVTHSSNKGEYYDSGMYPQKLMSFETEDGEEVPYSLYECEVELV